jgi:hypothetical protein
MSLQAFKVKHTRYFVQQQKREYKEARDLAEMRGELKSPGLFQVRFNCCSVCGICS